MSDVYQDLFGEGSYAGKGIYDIDAFEAALAGRVPDSTMLSHDLFEGVFARSGLASDIEVVEEYPARYGVDALRCHRWARGDWQLLPWVCGRGPTAGTDRLRGPMPAIGRWKMLDNLRRTLSAPACMFALLAGWNPPGAAAFASRAAILASYSACSRASRSFARASMAARERAISANRASRRASSSGIDIPSGTAAWSVASAFAISSAASACNCASILPACSYDSFSISLRKRRRNAAIVSWSGCWLAAMKRNATESWLARSSLRLENTPMAWP